MTDLTPERVHEWREALETISTMYDRYMRDPLKFSTDIEQAHDIGLQTALREVSAFATKALGDGK